MSDSLKENYQLGGNTFFVVAFGLLIPIQLYLGIRHRTWGFLFGIGAGLFLEVMGYVARVIMSQGEDQFIMTIVCLTIAPAFISASIYLCLARIITVYGANLSRFHPRTITLTFILADVGALLLQSTGGAVASQLDQETLDTGMSILQTGLGIHLASIALYVALSCDFGWTVWKSKGRRDARFVDLQSSKQFKLFLSALAIATLAILTRTAFRVAELSEGFGSDLAKNETLFFILEGTMILVACIGLTAFHPGIAFGGRWEEADFNLRSKKTAGGERMELV